MQQLLELLEQLRGLWRFRWVSMAVAWALCLLAWTMILLLPDRYEASATVFVNTQTALGAATRDITVDSSIESQIQRVRQALLGGPQLATIADETGLTALAITPQERHEVVEALRKQIRIEGGILRAEGAGNYVISYSHRDRETSLKVVDRFANTFVEESLGGKREGSEQAQRFLVERIAESEALLRQAEQRLAEFKKEYVGLLPDEQDNYFSRLQGEMDTQDKARSQLAVATRRRDELQRQLQGEQPLIAVPGQSGASGGASDTASRIREVRQQLNELLLSYTDKHPRVVSLRGTLTELEQRQKEEIEAARSGDAAAAARSGLAASPVYQELQTQRNQVGVDIAALQADIADRERRIASLRSMINTQPEVEAKYSQLNRDYDIEKARYESLVDQLGRTRLGEQAAQTGVVDFRIIDPPRAGFEPVFPRRPLLAIGALFASLAAGAGIAFLLNMLRPVFVSARQLHAVTGLPVLGAVSMTWIERHQSEQRRSVLSFAVVAAGLAVACGAYLVVHASLVRVLQGWVA